MARLPLLGRLRGREYAAILFGSVLVVFETLLTFIIAFLPKPVIQWFYDRSRSVFHIIVGPPVPKTEEERLSDRIRRAQDFEKLCEIFGYSFEEHVVLTKDGYLLGLHRLCLRRGEPPARLGVSTGKPVVYLHHGLLMNSEIWLCLTSPERCIPFVLVELGFDVWLGNNRGNKYSKKSIHHDPNSTKFWDYSIDDFAWHDIPDSIDYILNVTKEKSLSYIGFSQGTAQAFAALSIHPPLNERINVFIALAPAMSPAGLSAPIVDGMMKASINIPPTQKLAAYAHLYSFASVKSVVHWFQIMRHGKFHMYDDEVQPLTVPRGSHRPSGVTSYAPARFPTRNIVTPIVLLYGDSDSLVDIDQMVRELPTHSITVTPLHGYEHLDILWGKDVHRDVIPHVVEALRDCCVGPDRLQQEVKMVNGAHAIEPSGYSTPADSLADF
ncbi:hypothetical protein PHLCEN_2v8034 [Hermanssonia centrifuga]|uniref:Partial AB-hydrolase lipase domain-containing protein n=1 Tax=Hermanssonia centrifuga TaxID=98765 RepID=A0A2R6NUV8_9APHY|nr:hypothetical protein PHLCEN_2v8034 [Hermanssonia centrifuga]